MKFKNTARRRRIELVMLELISALTRSGLARNKSIIDVYLMAFSDVPWSISGLANASQMDRSIIRDHMNNSLAAGEYERSDAGFQLSKVGWRNCHRRVRHWQRRIHPDVRQFLYRFFKTKNKTEPMREYLMFILSLDRLARIVKLEFSYIVTMKVIEWEAPPEGVTINEIAQRTGFSYSVIHKQCSRMINEGYIERHKFGHVMTPAGIRRSFMIFISTWRAVTLKEWIVALKLMNVKLAILHDPPS